MRTNALLLGVLLLLAAGGQPAEPQAPNRLIHETSPYLLQHASNPVQWYAWGPEAFAAAREQDKPVFLSIGYSTCYWCHVMERESFEDPQVAALMNESFVCIKVDREERPDVDNIYMMAVQALAGRGGWPLSVFLEPETLKPFFGGTYFPPRTRAGRPAFTKVLEMVRDRWRDDRDGALSRADEIADRVVRSLATAAEPKALGRRQVESAVTGLMGAYDAEHGGFRKGKPKFPIPVQLEFLIGVAWDDPAVQKAIVHTLDRMAMGGMNDQIGGGFHRYSTDQFWLVPHFEKMLYDNAQLASVYAKAYELTGDLYYATVLEETLAYVLREMTSADGAFYSAQDAEANEREGGSYVWTPDEVWTVLPAAGLRDQMNFALEVYGLKRRANFIDIHHREDGPKHVLHLAQRPEALAFVLGLTADEFNERLSVVNAALLAARDQREQPLTDDKVLAEWNGLMISAMVDGAAALGDPTYLDAARRAARFVLENMTTEDGGLLRSWRSGEARINGFSSDYAHFVRGLLALYRGTGESVWLERAEELMQVAGRKFRDGRWGLYYNTMSDQEDLFVRAASTRDGVIPSANSVMLLNLLDLHELTGRAEWLDEASGLLTALSSHISRSPRSRVLATAALNRFLVQHADRVPAGPSDGPLPPDETVKADKPVEVPTPVEVTVSSPRILVSPEAPGRVEVTLNIDEGYHVNAHDPGVAGLTGVTVRLIGQGLELEADYPAGDPFQNALFEDNLLVHTGAVTIPLTVRQTGSWKGRPWFVLTYQVCTDRMCLEPARVLLPVRIESGGMSGDGVD
jgi:uncharacterized protein YyaL (SSP411 family)